jgi:DNA polymerase-3 subunit alpha
VAGHVLSVRRMTTKKGNLMTRFVLEDLDGEVEVMIFPKSLTPEVNELLVPGAMLVVKGQVENRDSGAGGERQILSEEVISFLNARSRFIRELTIAIQGQADDQLYNQLKELFGKYPGICRVNLLLSGENEPVLIETRAGIKPSNEFIVDLEKILGPESWMFGKKGEALCQKS